MNKINLLFFEAIVISILSFTYSIGWCSPTLPLPPPGTAYAQYWYTDYTLPFATIGFSAFGIFNIPSLNSSSGNLGIPNTFINYGSALSDFSLPFTSISLSSFATFNNFASSSPVTLNFSNTGTYNPIETYNIVTQPAAFSLNSPYIVFFIPAQPFSTTGFSTFGIFNIPSLNSSSGNLGTPNTFINYGFAFTDIP